jgi:hypothetical protein
MPNISYIFRNIVLFTAKMAKKQSFHLLTYVGDPVIKRGGLRSY